MEPSEALSTAAQVAVALAGFAGVVVAFRSSSLHEWPLLDKYRLWLLLSGALIPLFACLFALLLLALKPTPLSIWRWCSGFWFIMIFAFALLSRKRQADMGSSLMKQMGSYRYIYYIISVLGMAVGLLQAYNALILGAFWLFYAAVLFQLAVAALQFGRMILLPPQDLNSPKSPRG